MRPSSALLALPLSLLAACGDNRAPDEDVDATGAPRCAPPEKPLPEGPLTAVETYLPDCVADGLAALPGRWFVRDPDNNFIYEYPGFEGTCEGGFHQLGTPAEDIADPMGGFPRFYTWSDGTRFYNRSYFRFMSFEFASARVACLRPDGDLAYAQVRFDSDQGDVVFPMEGGHFAPKDEPAVGLTLAGELPTRPDGTPIEAYNLVLLDDLAYIAGPWGLDIVDVANPATPTHVGYLDGFYNDVKVVRGAGRTVAFMSSLVDENTVGIDVTDPAAPVIATEAPEFSHSVFVREDGPRTLLYLATYTHEVPVYDVTRPLQPARLGAVPVTGDSDGVHDLFAGDDDMLYVNFTTGGFVALDVAGGLDAPVERGRIPTPYSHASWAATVNGRRLVIHGDEGMTPDGGALLRILDGDPASPTFLQELSRYRTRPEVGIHNILIAGNKAYIAYYHDGVRVVDLTDPTRPVEVAHYNTWDAELSPGAPFEGALGLRYRDGLIYVADNLRGLLILREP